MSNGLDIDADDDGVLDQVPRVDHGNFHAIVQGKSVKKVKGEFKVTTASDLLYKKVKADINNTEELEKKLNSAAKEIYKDSAATSDDILQYNPVEDKKDLQEAYQDKLPEIIKDIHEDKKVIEEQAPTANAGGDTSIMIGSSVTLKASGFDIDGSIISYNWSENGNPLSDKQSFTYNPTTSGAHTLTLTVTDNDNLTATDSVLITVVEKTNTAPTAKEASYALEEDSNVNITLEGDDADNDALTYKVVVNPTYGTLSGEAPNLIYTPNKNYNGSDRFIFVSNDGKADSKRTEIKLTIQKINDKPVINPTETITINEDSSKKFKLNATDAEGDTLTYSITTPPTNGTVIHNGAEFTYKPKANYHGSDSFGVKSNDGNSDSEEVTIMIEVTEVNDAPTVEAGADKSITVGKTLTLTATANDIDGEIKSYRWFEGDKELSRKATATYTPTTVGAHTLSVTVTDDKDATATDRVLITVTAKPNTPPVATVQSISMKEDTTKAIKISGTDADNDTLTYTIKTQPRKGKLTGTAPNLTYAPNKDYYGADSFTFIANDGKDDSAIQTVSIMIADVEEPDVVKPVITLNGSATISLIQNTTYTDLGATAKDDRDGTVTVKSTSTVNTKKVGTYKVTYTATDKAGNKATKIRTINVTPPKVINLSQYASVVLGFSSQYLTSSWSAKQALGKSNVNTYGDNSLAWAPKSNSDGLQYISVGFSQAVFSTGVTIRESYGNGFVTKIETIDEANILHTVWSGTDNSQAGKVVDFKANWAKTTYPVIGVKITIDTDHSSSWEEIDSIKLDGISAGSATDKTAPYITLKGADVVTIVKGNAYTEQGATAVDARDGTVTVKSTGTVNTKKVGTYKVTYTATDKAGNKATKIRTVNVVLVADKTAPVITLKGAATVTVVQGNKYTDAGATAVDARDGVISIVPTGSVNTAKVGTYTLTFTATDKAGNKATKTRKVIVVAVDTVKPVITLNGQDALLLEFGKDTYTEQGASAIDDRDGTVTVTTTGTVDTTKVGTYTITYTATDKAGNKAIKIRIVKVKISKPFITKWKTDNDGRSEDNQLTIKVNNQVYDYGTKKTNHLKYNFDIDWGDGKKDNAVSETITHTYAQAGTYTVKITGEFPWFIAYDLNKLLSVEQWGSNIWESMQRSFYSCKNVVFNATDTPDLSQVTDMSNMFSGAENFNSPLNSWDVSHVINMSGMFEEVHAFNQPLNNWNVSNVTDMSDMFQSWRDNADDPNTFNQPLNKWDVSHVTNMSDMFYGQEAFNQPLNNWDVSHVTDMSGMFQEALSFNQPLDKWDVSHVTNMSVMFDRAVFNQPLNKWDVSSVTNMLLMFANTKSFNQPLDKWNTSNVTAMGRMFKEAKSFNQPIGGWDVSSVKSMASMFYSAKAFNQPLNDWDVSKVEDMSYMFSNGTVFNQPLNKWNVSSVTNMEGMFGADSYYRGAEDSCVFNQDISMWDVSSVTNMKGMFAENKTFNQAIGNWNVSNVTNMTQMFREAKNFNKPIGNWDVSNVKVMISMFYKAESFNQPIGNWDVSNIGKNEYGYFGMGAMFKDAKSFNQDISSWDVSNVKEFITYTIFDGAENFDLSSIKNWFDERIVAFISRLPNKYGKNKVIISNNGNRLFVKGKGVNIIDIQNKNAPVLLSSVNIDNQGKVKDFVLSPDEKTLYVIDVANTDGLIRYGYRDSNSTKGLRIIDISNIYNPVQKAFYHLNDATNIAYSAKKDVVYITDSSRLREIDVSDLTNLQEITTARHNNPVDMIHMLMSADENALYIAVTSLGGGVNYSATVSKDDISDKTQILTQTPRHSLDGALNGFYISKDKKNVFIRAGGKLIITDNTDAGMNELSSIESEGILGVVASQDTNTMYVNIGGKLHIYDISDKTNPVLSNTLYVGVHGKMALSQDNKTLYISNGTSVTIVDVSGE